MYIYIYIYIYMYVCVTLVRGFFETGDLLCMCGTCLLSWQAVCMLQAEYVSDGCKNLASDI